MGKIFASVTAFLGTVIALTSSGACYWLWIDEPELPKSLIK